MKYKYPIGTRIRYKGCVEEDVGKEGKIVGYESEFIVHIVVPGSRVAIDSYNDPLHSWTTFVTDIEVLIGKNQQLLFEFMY